jgi:ABC-2 type transport system ATP-binding protein
VYGETIPGIDEILANLDLTGKADSNTRALSGGMKRRVLVAQALVHRPPVIRCWMEPTGRCRCRIASDAVEVHPPPDAEGHTIVLTHALSRGSAGTVRPDRRCSRQVRSWRSTGPRT